MSFVLKLLMSIFGYYKSNYTIMKNFFLAICCFFFTPVIFSQAGHIMQGVGAVNMSMGGAATAQPLDINGALQWNPAAISKFDSKKISLSAGLFFSSPELHSSLPAGALGVGAPAVSGITKDDRGTSIMPGLAMVWGKENSKHTFGFSAFGISGFGVTFPEEANNPLNPNFNPLENSNPVNYPQQAQGFGHVESDYILLQIGLAYAYNITDKISVGIQPNVDYATLELAPNPLASPDFPPPFGTGKGYPVTDKASAIGFGAQVGLFYDSGNVLKLGASYKSQQYFSEFDFTNTYLDGSSAPNISFKMNYPAIYSVGLGLSGKKIDFALDLRYVDYENTDGFSASGWQIAASGPMAGFPTGAVNGFGWQNITILSAGLQYQVTQNIPVRIGYTYSSNPIPDELTFFSIPATAVIENAAQIGFGYKVNDVWNLDVVYHQGFRGRGSEGSILSPAAITPTNPLGAIPGTSVSYDMETALIQFSVTYSFDKNSK
jgi:long-chain fatty acid transport protein